MVSQKKNFYVFFHFFFREEVRGEFSHAYEGYLKHAYPFDELRPLSCDGVDTWGLVNIFPVQLTNLYLTFFFITTGNTPSL